MQGEAPSLRARRQRKTRDSLLDAAMALFAERGFDGVTVSEIAARAEVGRTTFFRYFTDKQELLFAHDEEFLDVLTEAVERAAAKAAPVGDSLTDALEITRAGLRAVATTAVRRVPWLSLRDRLIQENPALAARNLVKERHYAQVAVEVLVRNGATMETAVLAAGIAAACYQTAQITTAGDPHRLPDAIDAALRRLAGLDREALLARLGRDGLAN